MITVGLALAPDVEFLDLVGPLLREDAEHFEVAPETTWRTDSRGRLLPNGFHATFAELKRRTGRPFLAHGVGFSVGDAGEADEPRRQRWIARVAEDRATFAYRWYTDHLGVSSVDGEVTTLPLPLPPTRTAATVVRRRLRQMQRAVPDVGVENNVGYLFPGDPLDEPALIAAVCAAPRTHLLLDLHNVHTMALNFGFDPEEYLCRLPLERVIEVHLSGGSWSDGAWLPGGRSMRLDSHDAAIPDAVWLMLERTLPLCPNVQAITVERMEGTIATANDVGELRGELRQARRLVRRLR